MHHWPSADGTEQLSFRLRGLTYVLLGCERFWEVMEPLRVRDIVCNSAAPELFAVQLQTEACERLLRKHRGELHSEGDVRAICAQAHNRHLRIRSVVTVAVAYYYEDPAPAASAGRDPLRRVSGGSRASSPDSGVGRFSRSGYPSSASSPSSRRRKTASPVSSGDDVFGDLLAFDPSIQVPLDANGKGQKSKFQKLFDFNQRMKPRDSQGKKIKSKN